MDSVEDSPMNPSEPIEDSPFNPPESIEPVPIVPPGVKIKEGLSEDFIERFKRLTNKALEEPTPEDLKADAILLKKVFGPDLAAYVCKQETTRLLNRWTKGEAVPEYFEKRALIRATDIAKILIEKLTYKQARAWMITPCEYLGFEWPADVILEDPEMVRKAALWLF